jgi:hypothetical protein
MSLAVVGPIAYDYDFAGIWQNVRQVRGVLMTLDIRSVAGLPAWHVQEARQLTTEEAGGRHHVLVDACDGPQDARSRVQVRFGWDGQQPEEATAPVAMDKPADEPGASIPIWPGQLLWVEIADAAPSERMVGMDAYGCYYVRFVLSRG